MAEKWRTPKLRLDPAVTMPKRRAESPVVAASSSSSYASPIASTSTLPLRQSKRRKVTDAQASQQPQKKSKLPFKGLRKKSIKAKLAATMSIQVIPKVKDEPAPPTPDSLSSNVELPSKAEEELELLRKQLTEKDEQIKAQKLALSAIHQQVQCQICLDTLVRPYSLVPCGHVACLGCLQQWFSSPGPGTDAQPPAHIIVRRKKTCPHCRALVVQRPVAAFLIKEIILQVEGGLNANGAQTSNVVDAPRDEDVWINIFPPQFNGANRVMGGAIIDHEDGGVRRCNTCLTEIFHGVCQGCGEIYEFYDEDSDDSEMGMGMGPMPFFDILQAHDNPWSGDEEDEAYESDFVVNDDIVELEDHGDNYESHEELPFFHPVAQETIDISDDEDEEGPIIPPRRLRRNLSPIVVTDDDELSDAESREWGTPGAVQYGTIEVITDDDEGEEEDVNWALQHSPVRGYQYDDDDDEESGIMPQHYDQDEDVVVPPSWVDEEESVGYYSDEF